MKKSNLNYVFFIAIISTLLLSVIAIGVYSAVNQPKSKTIEITAERFKFTPSAITVNKGDVITLKIKSIDVTHGFFLDGYGIKKTIPGEGSVTITFTATKVGKFTFRCAITCGNFHPYMIGEIRVQPNTLYYSAIAVAGLITIGMVGISFNNAQRMKEIKPLAVLQVN